MAGVQNIVLRVGDIGDAAENEFAEVEYDVFFTDEEIRLDIAFTETVRIIEQNHDLDAFLAVDRVRAPLSWWGPHLFAKTGTTVADFDDQFIGVLHEGGSFRPGGVQRVHRRWRHAWNFPRVAGNERYRALVQVEPLISPAWVFSDAVAANIA